LESENPLKERAFAHSALDVDLEATLVQLAEEVRNNAKSPELNQKQIKGAVGMDAWMELKSMLLWDNEGVTAQLGAHLEPDGMFQFATNKSQTINSFNWFFFLFN